MRFFNTLHVYICVAGGASNFPILESSQDIRPLGSGSATRPVDEINEVMDEIISAVGAVNLNGIAPETVLARKVEIAHTVASGFQRIASCVEDELSLVAAQSAIEALDEETKERFNEIDKLLPSGTDLSSLVVEYLETVGREVKRKLEDSLLPEKRTPEQGDDVQIVDLAMEILVLPVVSDLLVSSSSVSIPRIIVEIFESFEDVLRGRFQQVREIKSIFSRFKIAAEFVETMDDYSLSTLSKKSLLIACSAVVRRNLVRIATSGSVGSMAVRFYTMEYVERFSDALDELDQDSSDFYEEDEVTRKDEIKWVSAMLEKFIDTYAEGSAGTSLKLSEVIKLARNEFSGSLSDSKKQDEIVGRLETCIENLMSELDEI